MTLLRFTVFVRVATNSARDLAMPQPSRLTSPCDMTPDLDHSVDSLQNAELTDWRDIRFIHPASSPRMGNETRFLFLVYKTPQREIRWIVSLPATKADPDTDAAEPCSGISMSRFLLFFKELKCIGGREGVGVLD